MAAEPTPAAIAAFGHIAAVLRAYMAHFGMNAPDFSQHVMGTNRANPSMYYYLRCAKAPNRSSAILISKETGIPLALLKPRDLDGPPPPKLPNPSSFTAPPSWRVLQRSEEIRQQFGGTIAEQESRAGRELVPFKGPRLPARVAAPAEAIDPLEFRAHADGTATLKVHVRIASDHAQRLLRVLLDSGIAP